MSGTYEGGGHAADGVAAGPDDLQRLVFAELQQQQVAPPGAHPQGGGALHQQSLHPGPGRRRLGRRLRLADRVPAAPGARVGPETDHSFSPALTTWRGGSMDQKGSIIKVKMLLSASPPVFTSFKRFSTCST